MIAYPTLSRLTEAVRAVDETQALEFVQTYCGPYLRQRAPDKLLYRGVINSPPPAAFYTKMVGPRVPRDMPPRVSRAVNRALTERGFKVNRLNSLYVTANPDVALEMSASAVVTVFPIGEFAFLWHPDIADLHEYLVKEAGNDYDIIPAATIQEIVSGYRDTGLADAMNANVEIMIHCDRVVYVNTDLAELWTETGQI